jgi:hypothetical protein
MVEPLYGGSRRPVAFVATEPLTFVPVAVTYPQSRPERTPPGDAGGEGRVRFPRVGLSPPLPGGSGPKRPAGILDRSAGVKLRCTGTAGAG